MGATHRAGSRALLRSGLGRRYRGRHAAPRQAWNRLRSRTGIAALVALTSLGGIGSAAGPTHGAPPSERVTASGAGSLGPGAGITGVGMQRGADRPSRDSARQAMADASGSDVKPAKSAESTQANPGLAKLAASAEKAAKQLSRNAWQIPITRGDYRLTARFGQCSSLWAHCHTGLDMAAPEGTPIRSVANGVVTGTGDAGAYGNRTVIRLDDGTEIWYCHQSSIGVSPGQTVGAGQLIGLVGSTGNTTGPHLHLEVRPGGGDAVDPEAALEAHGVTP